MVAVAATTTAAPIATMAPAVTPVMTAAAPTATAAATAMVTAALLNKNRQFCTLAKDSQESLARVILKLFVVYLHYMKVIHIKRPGMPINIRAIFWSGSAYESIPGLAHFTEHMIVSGTQKYPTKDGLSMNIEKEGGTFSASTNIDFIKLSIEIANKNDLPLAKDFFEQVVCFPLFDNSVIEKEKASIIVEQERSLANQDSSAWSNYVKTFFQDLPITKTILGTESSVKTVTKDNIVDFYRKIFLKSKCVVISSGDIEENEISDALTGIISNQNGSYPELSALRNDKELVNYYAFPGGQTSIIIGFRTNVTTATDWIVLELLSEIFARNRSSWLVKKLRYDLGYVYAVSGFNYKTPFWNTWGIKTSCSKNNTKKTIEVIKDELKRLFDYGISEAEFEFIKNKYSKTFQRNLQTSLSYVDHCEKALLINDGKYISPEETTRLIENISYEQVRSVTRNQFEDNQPLISLTGSGVD